MSFRLFIYYCAICGGWAAFFGWMFGRSTSWLLGAGGYIWHDTLMGFFAGFFIALGLGLVDALWNLSIRQPVQIFMRVAAAIMVGAFGGLLGGTIGGTIFSFVSVENPSLILQAIGGIGFTFGWTLVGFLIGCSIGFFELLTSVVKRKDIRGSIKKLIKAVVGGTVGGILGGILAFLLNSGIKAVLAGQTAQSLWSPTAIGLVILGMCIGLLIGLAQVVLREAWVRVEAGFRPGREKILSKEKSTIGRAEACDIGLFGDPGTEKFHANIVAMGNRYFLEDAGTPGGTFLNGQRIMSRSPLNNGDLIQVGKNSLRFNSRRK